MGASVLIGALELGLLYAIMGFGVYLSFRVLNIPDLTIDGSFTCGCAAAAMLPFASASPRIFIRSALAYVCAAVRPERKRSEFVFGRHMIERLAFIDRPRMERHTDIIKIEHKVSSVSSRTAARSR